MTSTPPPGFTAESWAAVEAAIDKSTYTDERGEKRVDVEAFNKGELALERIVAAAIKHPSGEVYSVPAPGRHHDVIREMVRARVWRDAEARAVQGFLTSTGRFVDRLEARQIAVAADQLTERALNLPSLYSEDVW